MSPEALRDAADWLGARLKAAPRPVRVPAPVPVSELPLFVDASAEKLVNPPAAVASAAGDTEQIMLNLD
ncbi:MAG: hypothetical protein PHQ05_10210 [Sterolibacterium sp.]|nr:hypothetical protein [Sterolibacterium sp.]